MYDEEVDKNCASIKEAPHQLDEGVEYFVCLPAPVWEQIGEKSFRPPP